MSGTGPIDPAKTAVLTIDLQNDFPASRRRLWPRRAGLGDAGGAAGQKSRR
jgi:nicotinamidase-related amidase